MQEIKDHIHCWDNKNNPCGLKEHSKCCLCEKIKPIAPEVRDSVDWSGLDHP